MSSFLQTSICVFEALLEYLNISSGRKEVDGVVFQNLYIATLEDGIEGVPMSLRSLNETLMTLIFDNFCFEYDWFKKIRLYPSCFRELTCLRGGGKQRDYQILTDILRLRDTPLKCCQKVNRWFKKNFGCCCGAMIPSYIEGMQLDWMESE